MFQWLILCRLEHVQCVNWTQEWCVRCLAQSVCDINLGPNTTPNTGKQLLQVIICSFPVFPHHFVEGADVTQYAYLVSIVLYGIYASCDYEWSMTVNKRWGIIAVSVTDCTRLFLLSSATFFPFFFFGLLTFVSSWLCMFAPPLNSLFGILSSCCYFVLSSELSLGIVSSWLLIFCPLLWTLFGIVSSWLLIFCPLLWTLSLALYRLGC